MENFTPIESLLGGMLIGLSAASVLFLHGRIAGISGICGAVLNPRSGDFGWRLAFLIGLAGVGAVLAPVFPASFVTEGVPGAPLVVAAGLLVGFGTRLGNGCTSGHGVCGISRLSRRSLVATATFMLTGGLTVYVVRHLIGGAG